MADPTHEQRGELEEQLMLEVLQFVETNSSLYRSGRELPGLKTLADGSKLKVEYSKEPADFDTHEDTINREQIKPLAKRLLQEGTPFTITSGQSDDTLQVKFSIERAE